jgi:hypothetical protein
MRSDILLIESATQVTDVGRRDVEVVCRLVLTIHMLYQWIRRSRVPDANRLVTRDQNAELQPQKKLILGG